MDWYLVHTKPRQERIALENLERQGYECYLPVLPSEKVRRGSVAVCDEPLFPRYMFIRLDTAMSSQSWSPIRSTRGVNRLVSFGSQPAKVDAALVNKLYSGEAARRGSPVPLFEPRSRLVLTGGAFAGLEGVYQMTDGEGRVMVLIELLSKQVRLAVGLAEVRRLA